MLWIPTVIDFSSLLRRALAILLRGSAVFLRHARLAHSLVLIVLRLHQVGRLHHEEWRFIGVGRVEPCVAARFRAQLRDGTRQVTRSEDQCSKGDGERADCEGGRQKSAVASSADR